MNKNVPHASSFRPHRVRMRLAELLGQAPCCFAEKLEVVQDPDLEHLVGIESRSPAERLAENSVDCREDIVKSLAVVSHSGTASANARSRTFGRSICSVATSTRTWSSA